MEKDLRRMREIEKTQILPFSGTTLTNSGLKGAAKTLTTHTAISYVLYEITIILIIDKTPIFPQSCFSFLQGC